MSEQARFAVLLLFLVAPALAGGDEIRVATASNFKRTMVEIAARFEAESTHDVTIISGSTGKHYAQIVQGAPFDLFFAADAERPRRLEDEGHAVNSERFTYATGKLVLWSPLENFVDSGGRVLADGDFRRIALANPDLAPYGRAARQALEAMALWKRLSGRVVRGENIAQAFQFVDSGSAELGFVARSQLSPDFPSRGGSYWLVPPGLHGAIEQQAVLLRDSPPARAFMVYVRGPEAAAIIRAHGYDLPPGSQADVE